MKSIFFILAVVIVSSCTTLSKKDCQTINWYEWGKSDALKGKTSMVFTDYTKTCSKHGIALDKDNYIKGRVEGLKNFCTYKNGEQFAHKGETYRSVCPQQWEPEFLKGYQLGKRNYELEQKERELELRKQDLEEQEAKLRSRQAILSSLKTKQCNLSSDCTIDDNCSLGKCKKSGAKCSFDSDCEIEGRCSLETVCAEGDCDTVNICKYD
ncbi:MAG: hypothetical protein A2622_05575 [Bdellovibrionales bacterium RIFCSPHIGHO2_01_FULL_40_29]|nr:MAG: hypothetical protein A2622_05575 [Bdellovibrionales bacterium RIFCSPHIGHO2_01_FULL_40_29]OFZ33134.1 MAG: hypothetical protein A3D17_13295 [Bdellovibrionales bacterium RIFCSPHIGHO2_02_FULL_40_15]